MSEEHGKSRDSREEVPTTERRQWVAPTATVEKVGQATRFNPTTGTDGVNCHS